MTNLFGTLCSVWFLSFVVGDIFSSFILDLNKRPAIPADFSSPLLHDLIEACWDKNPDNRPSFTTIIEKIRQLRRGTGESDDLLHTPTIPEMPEHDDELMPLSPTMSPKSFSPTFTCECHPDFNLVAELNFFGGLIYSDFTTIL